MTGTVVLIGVVMVVALFCGQDGPSSEEVANDEFWLKQYEREFYEIFVWNDPEAAPFCKAVWDLAEKRVEDDLFTLTLLKNNVSPWLSHHGDIGEEAYLLTNELRPVLEYLTWLVGDCLNDPRPTPAPWDEERLDAQ